MSKRLLTCSVRKNLEVGDRILPLLKADLRLAQPATLLQAGLDELHASSEAWTAAKANVRGNEAARNEAQRKLVGVLRELGMVSLSEGGNHHDVHPYVVIFPDGYGDLRGMKPRELIAFAGQVDTALVKEPDTKLSSYRQTIRDTCSEFVAIQEGYEAAVRTLTDARANEEAARSRFVRTLGQVRSLATSICDQQPGYLKDIFRPAWYNRKNSTQETEEKEPTETAETPSAPRGPSPPLPPPENVH